MRGLVQYVPVRRGDFRNRICAAFQITQYGFARCVCIHIKGIMPAIISHAECRARKGFTCVLIYFRDLQFCHFFICKRDNDWLRVCDFDVLMVIFVQNIALRRHFFCHGYRTGNILNRNLSASVSNIMSNCCSVHIDLEHSPSKPLLRAFVHLQNLQISAGGWRIRRVGIIRRSWLVWCIWVRICSLFTINQIYP